MKEDLRTYLQISLLVMQNTQSFYAVMAIQRAVHVWVFCNFGRLCDTWSARMIFILNATLFPNPEGQQFESFANMN